MADGLNVNSSAEQIASNYEYFKDYFADKQTDELGQSDFLMLMTEQMKNQDFMDPMDNSEYIAQLAQFNSLQQMQQMAYYTNATFAASLVGKTVTMAGDDGTGSIVTETGPVSAIQLNGENFEIVVNGKAFVTKNLMEISMGTTDTTENAQEPEEAEDDDQVDSAEGSDETNNQGENEGTNTDSTEGEEEQAPSYSQDIF